MGISGADWSGSLSELGRADIGWRRNGGAWGEDRTRGGVCKGLGGLVGVKRVKKWFENII